jgi:MFS family permease
MPDPQNSSPPRRRWWSLCVVALAIFTVTADAGQLNIALPAIIGEFKADLTLAAWVALVYALATASLYLPCGRLSDIVGSGRLFSFGFIFHAVFSLAGGFSQNGTQLIIFRGLQAAGSAFIMANNFAIVTALFPPEERGRAMGLSGGTVAALGYTLGPIIGGLLTHAFGWRSNLYFTAALGFIGFFAARKLLPQTAAHPSTQKREPFDFVGALTFALSISLILLALTTAQKGAFLDFLVIVEFTSGLLALGLFLPLSRARHTRSWISVCFVCPRSLWGTWRVLRVSSALAPMGCSCHFFYRWRVRWTRCAPDFWLRRRRWPWRCCRPWQAGFRNG